VSCYVLCLRAHIGSRPINATPVAMLGIDNRFTLQGFSPKKLVFRHSMAHYANCHVCAANGWNRNQIVFVFL